MKRKKATSTAAGTSRRVAGLREICARTASSRENERLATSRSHASGCPAASSSAALGTSPAARKQAPQARHVARAAPAAVAAAARACTRSRIARAAAALSGFSACAP